MKNSEKYSKSIIKPLDFTEHVKKRPFMYFGNIINLFLGLVTDCIEISKTDKIFFKIILLGDNDFAINISTRSSIKSFLEHFIHKTKDFENYYLPQVLNAISKTFCINQESDSETTISFSFDKTIIQNTTVDYLKLTESALLISVLNKQTEILTIDKRHKYLSQNYYHFPEGLFYLFDQVNKEVLGKPKFKITIDDIINSNQYQIGLAYRTDWYPTPHILSFANNAETKCGGSLVDGVFDGLLLACKTYINKNNLASFKVKRKKMLNGLIIVCSVRGQKFEFTGSFKETLKSEIVYEEAKKAVKKSVLDLLNKNNEIANDFLLRFDKTHLTSGMY